MCPALALEALTARCCLAPFSYFYALIPALPQSSHPLRASLTFAERAKGLASGILLPVRGCLARGFVVVTLVVAE